MQCPVCHSDTKVVDSRLVHESQRIRRRRRCFGCEFKFSTLEVVLSHDDDEFPPPFGVDAIKRAINFVADAHAALKKQLGRME